MIKLRVKDYLYDENDQPLTDSETGLPCKNNLSLFRGPKKHHFPGEVFEADDNEVKELLRPPGLNRPVMVETVDEATARAERIRQRELERINPGRSAIEREMSMLDQNFAALARTRQLVQEKELEAALARAPGQAAAHVLQALHAMPQQPDMSVVMQRLEAAEASSRKAHEEAAALREQLAEARKGGPRK